MSIIMLSLSIPPLLSAVFRDSDMMSAVSQTVLADWTSIRRGGGLGVNVVPKDHARVDYGDHAGGEQYW